MRVGRPQKVDPGSLYVFAHQFYWDFRRLAEGRSRWRTNKKKLEQLESEVENEDLQLDDEGKKRLERLVEEEIHDGRLHQDQRDERLQEIQAYQLSLTRKWRRHEAAEEAREVLRVPGEPEVIATLLDPSATPEQIREICKTSIMTRTVQVEPGVMKEIEVPAWPIPAGSPLPTYLSQYAEQYVAALHDHRFPSCDVAARPSTRLKQFWFLSRALAGALFGVTTRTAINLVGSLRPEESFEESRAAKPERKRTRHKYKFRRTS